MRETGRRQCWPCTVAPQQGLATSVQPCRAAPRHASPRAALGGQSTAPRVLCRAPSPPDWHASPMISSGQQGQGPSTAHNLATSHLSTSRATSVYFNYPRIRPQEWPPKRHLTTRSYQQQGGKGATHNWHIPPRLRHDLHGWHHHWNYHATQPLCTSKQRRGGSLQNSNYESCTVGRT